MVNLRMQNAKAETLEFHQNRPAGPPVLGTWHMGIGAVQLRMEGIPGSKHGQKGNGISFQYSIVCIPVKSTGFDVSYQLISS